MDRQTIGGVDHEVLAEQTDGGGVYEWANVALLRRVNDGQLFLVTEEGCSCNGPWDDPDLEPVDTWQAALERLKADRPYLFNDDDVAAFAQQLMELRPAPSAAADRG